jgi:hypothetical protein
MISVFVRRHAFVIYYLFAFAIACAVQASGTHGGEVFKRMFLFFKDHHIYPNLVSIARFAIEGRVPGAFSIFFFAGAPTISAIVVTSLGWGWKGLARLFSRFQPWREGVTAREALPLYGTLLALFFVMLGVYLWIAYAVGLPGDFSNSLSLLNGAPLLIVLTAFVGMFIDEGGTLEETGWRGFALPILQRRLATPLLAAVVLGVLWWFWHFPREVPTLLAGTNYLVWAGYQFEFVVLVVGEAIIMAYVVNRSGGSILPAIMVHGGMNVWTKAAGAGAYHALGLFDLRLAFVIVTALVLILGIGSQLGRRVFPDAPGALPEAAAPVR